MEQARTRPQLKSMGDHNLKAMLISHPAAQRGRQLTSMLKPAPCWMKTLNIFCTRHSPPHVSTPCAACDGIYIEDLQGRRYMDFHGNNVHQVGFSNPAVISAIKTQLDDLSFCTRRYTNQVAVDLAKKLTEIAPGDLNKVFSAPAAQKQWGSHSSWRGWPPVGTRRSPCGTLSMGLHWMPFQSVERPSSARISAPCCPEPSTSPHLMSTAVCGTATNGEAAI